MSKIPALVVLILCACLVACGGNKNQALGTLERDRIILKATANEIIVSEPVAEGVMVARGQLLVQLDDRQQRAMVAQAQAQVAEAFAKYEEMRNGARAEDVAVAQAHLMGMRAEMLESEKSYLRTQQLVEQRLASQSDLDTARASRDSSEAKVASAAEELLLLTNGTRPEKLAQGEASYQAAIAQLASQQASLDDLSVKATRDAYLDSLPWHIGERVTAGATLAVLLAGDSPYARVYVPEKWRAGFRVGDLRSLHVDGVDKPFQARLRWIATDPAFTPYYALNAEDRSRLVYLAEFDVIDGEDLPTGLPVQLDLTAGTGGSAAK